MATTAHRETAKIYTFPTRSSAKADTFRGETNAVASFASSRVANVSFDAWYHDEAIEEAAREKGN